MIDKIYCECGRALTADTSREKGLCAVCDDPLYRENLDKKLISRLDTKESLTTAQIARLFPVTRRTVLRRLRGLEREGIVYGRCVALCSGGRAVAWRRVC